jgi:hypothetical protein
MLLELITLQVADQAAAMLHLATPLLALLVMAEVELVVANPQTHLRELQIQVQEAAVKAAVAQVLMADQVLSLLDMQRYKEINK